MPSSQLLEQSGLLSQGVMAVVCESLQCVHWAKIWVKSKQLTQALSKRGLRAKGNALDWILKHFTVSFLAYSGNLPTGGGWSLTVMTIAAQTKYQSKNHVKCTISKSYNYVQSYCYNYSTNTRRAPRRVSREKIAKTLNHPIPSNMMFLASFYVEGGLSRGGRV